MVWKHYQVGRGLFGIRLPIPNFKFQFSKSIKPSTFRIFLNLTYLLRKNISFPKCPRITQKCTQNRQTVVMVISIEIQRCLKRDRHIGRKAVLSDVKTAFTCTPALLPFSNYRERHTFFRTVTRLKYLMKNIEAKTDTLHL